jgi:hypothetical protein
MALWNKTPAPDSKAEVEAEKMYRESLMNNLGAAVSPSVNSVDLARRISSYSPGTVVASRPDVDLNSDRGRLNMLAMRLRVKEGEVWPFDSIQTSLGNEKIFVFIVQGDKPAILEDDADLFPSDTLVTQLRLIAK